ncbi:MAG: class I SAM-dependent methyltransferase [Planctomycetales bacterium]|nr:class I SAM-dependent methyltransferase [Planctomycetales bacterium]
MISSAQVFDSTAADYEAQLDRGISLSGEGAEYFVNGRIAALSGFLREGEYGETQRVLDFGCGVGNACGELRQQLGARMVAGVDCSEESLNIARQRWGSNDYRWLVDCAQLEPQSVDVAYTSGVFHHIPPHLRQVELEKIHTALRPGGLLALFENNPWNPGTRWVMSRIAFDREAICLSLLESRRRMKAVGFELLSTWSMFYFPHCLRLLRPLEKWMSTVPLGAQYVCIGRKSP